MKTRTTSRLSWIALVCIGVIIIAGEAYSVQSRSGPDLFVAAGLIFPAVGALILSRQARNTIGWIMLGIGFVDALGVALEVYSDYGLAHSGSLPSPDVALALSQPLWVPGIGLIGTFLILLFPDGHLPSHRWRPWAWLCATTLTLCSAVLLFAPGDFADSGYPGVVNPLGVEAFRSVDVLFVVLIALIPVCIVGCAVSLVRRFRRSRGQERLQLKWLAAAGGVAAAAYLILMMINLPFIFAEATPSWIELAGNIGIFAFFLIPVAIGIAILKHRLYDLDFIINRTLVYAVLTTLLVLVYVAGVVGLGGILRELTGQQDNNLAVAATTLAVAALFRPARARIQGFIDRRFYRRKYDAAQTLERFSARLRDEVDLDELSADLLTAIKETMQPAHASLWLRSGAGR
jgi:hypothetical protein